jgi:hypothetical protein
MLIRPVYGKTITVHYIPAGDGEEYEPYSLVSARIYGPDTFPSDARIDDAAGVLGGFIGSPVTSWTRVNFEGTGSSEYLITFPPIPDPYPTIRTGFNRYYVALNFKADAVGANLRDVPEVVLWRTHGLNGKIRVSAQDVYDIDDTIELTASSQLWVEAKIDLAILHLTQRLKGRGYEKSFAFDMEELSPAAALLSASYCAFAFAGQGNPVWFDKAKMWRADAAELERIAKVGYDAEGSGMPDPKATVQTGAKIWIR